jgi:transposase
MPDGSAIAKAIDYSLKRWEPLTGYLDDGNVPIDNNELVAGSLRTGQRAAAVMGLIQSTRLNGHDAFAYMKDVLERLPSLPASRIDELLPHCWRPVE